MINKHKKPSPVKAKVTSEKATQPVKEVLLRVCA